MNFHLHHHSFATVDALVCRLIFEISKLYSALAMKIGEYVLQTIMMESYPEKLAVLRHLGHFSNEDITVDEAELQCHQKLQDLYISTKVAKHLQRNIVRGIEDFIATSTKLIEIARKLADDCCKYRAENENTGSPLARAALYFGKSHKSMEDEREALLGILGEKVSEPLRALIMGAPLENARHLTHRYDRFHQEVEAQDMHDLLSAIFFFTNRKQKFCDVDRRPGNLIYLRKAT
ncbi:SH3 domain-containing protein 1-like [Hibiscus syriacus]|uniref:SH3 domain-containing protein 1-like n=1 Tax=Hibiscus syriacus TaxID=106335 RepID=UPI001924FF8F|nr:SH3 domain-containing protein 1-like [Hibiscus syriacus]